MKTIIWIWLVLLIFSCTDLRAQNADTLLNNLTRRKDWFALDEIYPTIKEGIKEPGSRVSSEIFLSLHFNQPKNALRLIDSSLSSCQDNMKIFLFFLKAKIFGEEGLYAQRADVMHDLQNKIAVSDKKTASQLQIVIEPYDAVRNIPKPEIIRPKKDTEIPIYTKKAGKGKHMLIPVTIHGKAYRFIFDTGASTFVSERFANEVGIHIMKDSVYTRGICGSIMGKSGIIDSLNIGDIVFKNPIITIAPLNTAIDTIFQIDGILGLDFIRRIGETQIFPAEGKICFPYKQSPLPSTGKNMMIDDNGQPYLKVYSNGERLIFHFDTGDTGGDLYDAYYRKHKNIIDSIGTKDSTKRAGLGGICIVDGFKIPTLKLKIGSVNFELPDISVVTAPLGEYQNQEDGDLGMNFISTFKKITINFDKMFVEVGNKK